VDSHCDPQQLTSRPAQQTIMGKRHWGGALWVGWVAGFARSGWVRGPGERQTGIQGGELVLDGWNYPLRVGTGARKGENLASTGVAWWGCGRCACSGGESGRRGRSFTPEGGQMSVTRSSRHSATVSVG
jgi:hypothetical protein